MQAIQAGNEMAANQVQQLQRLQQLLMVQMNMQAQAMASQTRENAERAAAEQSYIVHPTAMPAAPSENWQVAPTATGE